MEPISPSVWRSARRNTVRRVSAVRIARGAYQGCPPRVVRGRLRAPSRDRLLREPDRQAPALTQAGVLRAPVRHPVALLGDVVTASGMGLERHKQFPGIVGGGGSLPHPPCEAKRATAVACTILPDWPGQPGGLPPGVLGPPGRRHPGSRGARGVFLVTSRSRGHTHLPDAPVPASGADGAPPRPAVPIRATRSGQTRKPSAFWRWASLQVGRHWPEGQV